MGVEKVWDWLGRIGAVKCTPLDPDTPLPIREWQQRYERYLDLIGKKETRKRYGRALERFFGKHPHRNLWSPVPPTCNNSYVETRLAEGASIATVRLELSAIRGLFQFALDMGASDVLFNAAKGVKVRKPKSKLPEANKRATEPLA